MNLLYSKLASNRLVRWRMMLEEFGPKIEHIKGTTNVVADALSRLEIDHKDSDEIETDDDRPQLSYMTVCEAKSEEFPINPQLIKKEQNKDKDIKLKIREDKDKSYSKKK